MIRSSEPVCINYSDMSVAPFNRLVKLVARAFYDDIAMKGDNQPKTGRSDNRGRALVVLDALTRRQWVREEDLAKDLKLHSKQLRRTLRFFEEQKLITRDHRKEIAKGAKVYSAAVAATSKGQQTGREGEEKIKLHTHSYCCLDYAQIYTVVRYRQHLMKKKLEDDVGNKNTVQEYMCPDCGRRYNALDALELISRNNEYFHCEKCNSELVPENDKLAAKEMGDGDDNARRRRREKSEDMLEKMEVQLKPLMEQLDRVKYLSVPEFGSLQAWEGRASAAARAANGDSAANDSSKASEDTKADAGTNFVKVMPFWMIKQGMNLTTEQRGEVKQESEIDNGPAFMSNDKKKSKVNEGEDENKIQNEYVKAYYAAILRRQQEQEEAAKRQQELENKSNDLNGVIDIPYDRKVGMKSKRDMYEGEDGVEWEEGSTAGNTSETYKLNRLNVQAEAPGDGEDETDWEEGEIGLF